MAEKMRKKTELFIDSLDSALQSTALSLSMCEEMQLHCGPLHQKNPLYLITSVLKQQENNYCSYFRVAYCFHTYDLSAKVNTD